MNTIEAIKNRKSSRVYLDKDVEDDKINTIVKAGYMAASTPLAGKTYFHVITDEKILTLIKDNAKKIMLNSGMEMLEKMASNPEFNPIYDAPVAILISTDKTENPNTKEMAIANASCAAQNMLIAATDLELGSCFVESPVLAFKIPGTKESLNLTDDMEPICMVLIGYSPDNKPHEEYPENPDTIYYY